MLLEMLGTRNVSTKNTVVIPGERSEAERGKGTQAANTVTVFPTWVPFPSLSLGRG